MNRTTDKEIVVNSYDGILYSNFFQTTKKPKLDEFHAHVLNEARQKTEHFV